ncbi:hypothetical protein FXO38_31574 [Capsicum annuum]|uniref:Uncharacterized protein n=1 Tax=Capsicum annuum TaxID=4072 RepID=A0A2G2Z2C7_CAPAN|nr:hypothetical protein FXO37_34576 [Capsicum annuum]KAF3621970.1 hypothetical protein FXO38_31574 [Capsicum annuum]PHT76123.1 hypothetical protein T459_19645 [Capsicum annuum]
MGGDYDGAPPRTQASCRTDHAGLIDGDPRIKVPYPFQYGAPSFDAYEAFDFDKKVNAASNGLSFLPMLIDILVSGMSMCEDSTIAATLASRHISYGKHLGPVFYSVVTITLPSEHAKKVVEVVCLPSLAPLYDEMLLVIKVDLRLECGLTLMVDIGPRCCSSLRIDLGKEFYSSLKDNYDQVVSLSGMRNTVMKR